MFNLFFSPSPIKVCRFPVVIHVSQAAGFHKQCFRVASCKLLLGNNRRHSPAYSAFRVVIRSQEIQERTEDSLVHECLSCFRVPRDACSEFRFTLNMNFAGHVSFRTHYVFAAEMQLQSHYSHPLFMVDVHFFGSFSQQSFEVLPVCWPIMNSFYCLASVAAANVSVES